ncbi:MAG: phenylalanine--tRNA ligase subunit beta [Peptococcaceae bacterium]|jgi:phenylalanyl-tRNA synthetase beta chain|nr:phenylalanine--tRNA ligase subunit beta [Peptococcaceae bacterium]MDH7523877.1 phenylalanine--tRNA ligase subunit beta [Peptococcaceae bacterium]
MRVSWNWLKELVELNIEPEELAHLLTMSGLEVEAIERLNKGVGGVKVGLVREVRVHPQAGRLLVCRVETGEGNSITVVSGAQNLKTGQKVPVALPGASLAGGVRVGKASFLGVESEGMLCSAEELGLDVDKLPAEDKEGIYLLPADVLVGQDVVDVLGLNDIILELGLTPNRSDCLGMVNVAREVAALTGGRLKLPVIEESKTGGKCASLTSVEIMEPELCRRYVARIIKNVHVGKSPLWMRHRLLAGGIRPINSIVDVTNYVMLEMGQPMHAFDYDRLVENRIVVRKARPGEEITTLDGQKRVLGPEMLVIADAEKPVGIAGVMGGLETEVTEETKTVLLEAAFFNGPNNRRTSQTLGLKSEASLRFEKEVDLERVSLAADRAVQLIALLGAGVPVSGNVDCFPNPERKEPLRLRLDRVNKILGTSLDEKAVETVLDSLQVRVINKENGGWTVETPSHRRDLQREIDLIEEVARLHGYERIPTTLPYGAVTQGGRAWAQRVRRRVSSLMSAQGLYEIVTFSFVNPRHLDWLRLPEGDELRQAVVVKNPLSEEQGIMRTTLLPGLLETVRNNIAKRNHNIAVYELGKIYQQDGFPEHSPLPLEKWVLGGAATGAEEKSWAYPGRFYDFYYLKGVVENLLSGLGINNREFKSDSGRPFLHPGRAARVLVNGKNAGWLGELHPLVLENYELEQETVAFMLDMDILTQEAQEKVQYTPLPRYPAVTRDLAVIVPEGVEAAAVERIIKETGQPSLKQVKLFDVYKGKQIEKGFKSLAFSLSWQAEDRTLTDEEVNTLHQQVLAALEQRFGARIRQA